MPVTSTRAEILSSIDEHKALICANIAAMHGSVIATRALIEQTREWLRELDRLPRW